MSIVYSLRGIFRHEHWGSLFFSVNGSTFAFDHFTTRIISMLQTTSLDLSQLEHLLSMFGEFENKEKDKLHDFLKWGMQNGIIIPQFKATTDATLDKAIIDKLMTVDVLLENSTHALLTLPVSVAVYPTFNCNQRCLFCYTDSGSVSIGEKQSTLPMTIWDRLIDEMIDACIPRLSILGGEPFSEQHMTIALLQKASTHCLTRVFTNGTWKGGISDKLAHRLADIPNIEIVFNINAYTSQLHDSLVGLTGSQACVIASAKRLLALNNVLVSANITVNNSNIDEVVQLAIYLAELGFHSIDLKPIEIAGRAIMNKHLFPCAMQFESIVQQTIELLSAKGLPMSVSFTPRHAPKAKKGHIRSCYSGEIAEFQMGGCTGDREASIDPFGNTYCCSCAIRNPRYAVGNIKSHTLREIWKNVKHWPLTRPYNWNNDPVCRECTDLPRCLGGCPWMSNVFFDSYDFGDPYCPRIHAFYFKDCECQKAEAACSTL